MQLVSHEKGGEKNESGDDNSVIRDVLAAMAVANVVKSSLGPVGLDKMLVDDIGDLPSPTMVPLFCLC
ncbi:ATV_HP_G0013770.mRNA.1.CDS.1 [Saccharomyces cerevisiae]|nr:ATV_HP_G0013770.mRNA.1.CDS.1 [Saccharomyces cerevisiae]CAI6948650.1 ATV_HP_G0013770.mRNA.1.CDS.1 [Saccharomyces cerevisiae]